MDGPLRFYSPYADTKTGLSRLPHWQQTEAVYFVTFRLADSIPLALREKWVADREAWFQHNPLPHTRAQEEDFQREFSMRIEEWLDAGNGCCILHNSDVAEIVLKALKHFEGMKSHLFSAVIMPNHVHALFATIGNAEVKDLVHSWKGFTTHLLYAKLGGDWPGWQKDYFDRIVRDGAHFERCVRYIRKNPQRAGLSVGQFVLFENERAQRLL